MGSAVVLHERAGVNERLPPARAGPKCRLEVDVAVKPVPEGYRTVTPYLIVNDANALLTFVREAFKATIVEEHRTPDGRVVHADFMIGDSHVMAGQGSDQWPAQPGTVLLYVEDADASYKAALAAGGVSIQEMATQFYGDRSGGVRDPSGVTWWISTHVEDVSREEMERRMAAARK
jgi:PhnB protein